MPPILRQVLAVIVGVILGSVVNMAIITASPLIVPPPPGVDLSDPERFKEAMALLTPAHFLMPFLAHALGTLVGATLAHVIGASSRARLAYVVGVFFLAGGVAASFMIPAPAWFIALDLVVAYLPMAWVGIQIGGRLRPS